MGTRRGAAEKTTTYAQSHTHRLTKIGHEASIEAVVVAVLKRKYKS